MYFAPTNPRIANDMKTRCFIGKIKYVDIFTYIVKKVSKNMSIGTALEDL